MESEVEVVILTFPEKSYLRIKFPSKNDRLRPARCSWVWIVDTDNQTIEQYLLEKSHYQLAQKLKSGTLESEVIKGFQINVTEIFE